MPYGRKFVQQKAQEEAKNNPGPETSVEDSPSDKKSSLKMKMLGVGKKDSGFAGVVKAVIPAQQKPAPLVPQRPQRHIPYVVIRPGALVQSKPEKGSGRVAKLTNNSKVSPCWRDILVFSLFTIYIYLFADLGICQYEEGRQVTKRILLD